MTARFENCEDCDSILRRKNFKTRTLLYCDKCGWHRVVDLECDHEFEKMLFILDNGNKQLRDICVKCWMRSNKILSQKGIDLVSIVERSEKKYNEYREELFNEDKNILSGIVDDLCKRQHEVYYKRYYDYINSPKWKERRQLILSRDLWVCQICSNKATDVHHLSYAHFENEYDFELVSLCGKCHKMHYHSDATKDFLKSIGIPK